MIWHDFSISHKRWVLSHFMHFKNDFSVNSIGQKKSFLANLEVLNFVFWSVWAIFQVPNLPKDLFYVKLKNSVIWQCGNLMILHSLLIFYGKLKNQVKSQCGNLMISHSISQISCEITFMQMQKLSFWPIWRFWIALFSHFCTFWRLKNYKYKILPILASTYVDLVIFSLKKCAKMT